MKKIAILFLALMLLSGCQTQEETPEAISTIEPTPVVTTESEQLQSEEEKTDSAGAGQNPEIEEDPQFTETAMEASYIENTENSPTTMTFHEDHRVEVNLNVCSGMSELKGNYSLEDQVVTIWFEESTGYEFLDQGIFKFDLGADRSLIRQADSEMFSCSGISPETYNLVQ